MRFPFPSNKSVESQTGCAHDELMKALGSYSTEDRAAMSQALLYLDQQAAEAKMIREGGCTGPFKEASPGPFSKDWQGCVSVGSGPVSGSFCLGGKEAEIVPDQGCWSAQVDSKTLKVDLAELNKRASIHGYRPILAIDEGKYVLGFLPLEGSKGLVTDPYQAGKDIFGPLLSKGVSVSLGVRIPL
jgi:hypothetical protein